MSLKDKVDKYLKENFDTIESSRTDSDFRWTSVTANIDKALDSNYVRNRFAKIRKAKGVYNSNSFNYLLKEDTIKGEATLTFTADSPPTEEQIIEWFKVDTKKYRINQVYHKTSFGGKYAITVSLLALKGSQTLDVSTDFLDKLEDVKPLSAFPTIKTRSIGKPNVALLIPKQDAHFNKYDIDGKNNIAERFKSFTRSLLNQLEKVSATSNIEKIFYIIGSDEFNSEWTGNTTKGTPQQNILTYEQGFEAISEFNIAITRLLKAYSIEVEIILLNGNHDHNVSWHLAHLLSRLFSNTPGITVNSELVNTKIITYGKNLIALNHGDVTKPKDLASKLPILAKDKWSSHDNYFIITGDKHTELAQDFNGILCYRVPQLSSSKSAWDDKNNYITSKPEMLTFVFQETYLSDIIREPML
jgi:predicted phosphodiesterase